MFLFFVFLFGLLLKETRKCLYLVIGNLQSYFVQNHSDYTHKYSKVDMKKMLGFLIVNTYVVFVKYTRLPTVCWNSHGRKMCSTMLTLFYIHWKLNLFKSLCRKNKTSTRHLDIMKLFCPFTTVNFTFMLNQCNIVSME